MRIHPRWFDGDFWGFISQELMRLDIDAMRQRAKRKARERSAEHALSNVEGG